MSFFIRGALVEYGSDVMGPIPNIVVFQFNPEQISRTINIPNVRDPENAEENAGPCRSEVHQMSGSPTETFSITAHFSAADNLGRNDARSVVPRAFGIGPQLAALEKMVYPEEGLITQLVGAAVDAVGDALGGEDETEQNVPREQAPRILFVWGPARVLPVKVRSMTITEEKYDPLLNPVQAQVEIGLGVANLENSDDAVGKGALKYTQTLKATQAELNLAKAAELAVDIIPF